MSFAVLFRRELTAGVCVGVSLPSGDGFATPAELHPDATALAHASPESRRATFIGGRVALRAALAALGAETDTPLLSTPRGAAGVAAGFVGSGRHQGHGA